jgi:hypothetical protein
MILLKEVVEQDCHGAQYPVPSVVAPVSVCFSSFQLAAGYHGQKLVAAHGDCGPILRHTWQ